MATDTNKLNSVEKKALAEILRRVADSQRTQLDSYVKELQRAIKEKHQDDNNVPELLKKLQTAREERQELEEKKRIELENFKKNQEDEIKLAKAKEGRIVQTMADKGFESDGDYLRENRYHRNEELEFVSREGLRKSATMQNEYNTVAERAIMRSNKIDEAETMIWTAQSRDEANSVMAKVIGGGLIDGTSQFAQLEAPKK